jgi:chromosome segregation ATPase
MDGFSSSQFLLILSGASGAIVVLIKIFTVIAAELDARRKRHEAGEQKRLGEAVEIRRLQLDYTGKGTDTLVENLWKMIGEKEKEIEDLKKELDDSEKAERLNRPTIMRIYSHIREMRTELDSLNVMVLDEEQTNVFMRRFRNVKEILNKVEAVLSGDDTAGANVK